MKDFEKIVYTIMSKKVLDERACKYRGWDIFFLENHLCFSVKCSYARMAILCFYEGKEIVREGPRRLHEEFLVSTMKGCLLSKFIYR